MVADRLPSSFRMLFRIEKRYSSSTLVPIRRYAYDCPANILDDLKPCTKEASPLRDTAAEIRLVPRQPTMVEFIPIGHVALDVHEPDEDIKLGLPATGTVWVHQLYISRALHGGGFGAGAMSKIETLATRSPMNAKIVALDTLSKEMQTEPEIRDLLYGEGRIPPPVVSRGSIVRSCSTPKTC